MIRSFADRETEKVWEGEAPKRLPKDVQIVGLRKLILLEAAEALEDLRNPPDNRLEMLRGDRDGQWSIRINRQWRICFRWVNGYAQDVEIVDYH